MLNLPGLSTAGAERNRRLLYRPCHSSLVLRPHSLLRVLISRRRPALLTVESGRGVSMRTIFDKVLR